jgi:hypothetical protein
MATHSPALRAFQTAQGAAVQKFKVKGRRRSVQNVQFGLLSKIQGSKIFNVGA